VFSLSGTTTPTRQPLKILRKTDRFLANCDVNRDQTVIHEHEDSRTGAPRGGILASLLANILKRQ
jgi:hypothetical protein